ncbi:hypothetical protein GQ55_6G242600 [Panicum hallii var. hallii]|uniref:Uncharacterized protein n=1 Tax=Panicum hallii var. hallii TaxID=1504633 RepID=A0A2T7D921_9POAL|nr:hypothetical protein GQ55_6G242600 [Panicum hallii var. hallii]
MSGEVVGRVGKARVAFGRTAPPTPMSDGSRRACPRANSGKWKLGPSRKARPRNAASRRVQPRRQGCWSSAEEAADRRSRGGNAMQVAARSTVGLRP